LRRTAALPFRQSRKQDAFDAEGVTSTTETVHGLMRLEGDQVVIQWRAATRVDRVGMEIRTDEEVGDVREVVVPLEAVAGATVQRPWWRRLRGPRVLLLASDLRAFEDLSGEEGLRLAHPAELVVDVPRKARLAAEEFAAELELARAELLSETSRRRLDREVPGRHSPPPTTES
jgi:hypothetical protein